MSPNLGVACEPAPLLDPEPERGSPNHALVLIRVPALPPEPHFRRGPHSLRGRSMPPTRRRRRLRREVRVAALALLFALPTAGLLLRFGPTVPERPTPDSTLVASIPDVRLAAEEPSVQTWVTISLEPAAGDRIPDLQTPVVRPSGFLLPDHGSEEPAHAGG